MTTKTANETTTTQEKKALTAFEKRKKDINFVLDYATRVYGCTFPKNTLKDFLRIEGVTVIPTAKSIDGLVAEWNIWKEYLDEDSFSDFILDGIKSFLTIHTTATSNSKMFNDFVGNKAKIVKELPSSSLSTVVTMSGILLVNGRKVKR